MHWIPSEVSLNEDVRDWNKNLTNEEKRLITQIFRFFTLGDIDVADGYLRHYLNVFNPVPVRMMLATFASMEAIHVQAYSLLLDTVGLPDSEYDAFKQYREMVAKHDYVNSISLINSSVFNLDKESYNTNTLRKIAKSLAIYSAFSEGLQLFSSFAILFSFPERGLMKGMRQILKWSTLDEELHVSSMIRLFHQFVDQFPEIWNDSLKKEIYQICREMVELEFNFIDLAFKEGDLVNLSVSDLKEYIRFLADKRLLQLGLKPNYGVKNNPLKWLEDQFDTVDHVNFFENRETQYSKGSVKGSLRKSSL
jgi:ribonucleoside-diphosphate reductase beta chain